VEKGVEKRVAKKVNEGEAKGEVRQQKMSVGRIGKLTSYISNLLAYFGIEVSLPRPTTSLEGPRLLLFDY
jgi:hypothetical protein